MGSLNSPIAKITENVERLAKMYNEQDGVKDGLLGNSTMTESLKTQKMVEEIRMLLATGFSKTAIRQKLGISRQELNQLIEKYHLMPKLEQLRLFD